MTIVEVRNEGAGWFLLWVPSGVRAYTYDVHKDDEQAHLGLERLVRRVKRG